MTNVSAIVPNWNRRELLVGLLSRLRNQSRPLEEILVVDGGSTDGSAEAAEVTGARVIRMSANAGFSRAVNRGIEAARSPWLAIVNNDVEPEENWLENLLQAAERTGAWFACGKLVEDARRDRIDGTYDLLCRGGCAWRAGKGRLDGPEWDRPRSISLAPLTAALIRAEVFGRVGLLDERFESYLEDVDLGLRCAARGLTGVYVPGAVARHAGSATLGAWHPSMVRHIARNQVFLLARHYPSRWFRECGWHVLVAQGLWGLLALRHGRGLAWLAGKWEGLRRFPEMRGMLGQEESDRVRRTIKEGEEELFTLQQQTGFDLFWRIYFALT